MSKTGYLTKTGLIYLLTLGDLCINGFADHNPLPENESWMPFVWIGVQIAIQILNILLMFLLFFGTYLFQVGLISEVLREFRSILYVMFIYFTVYGIYAGVKLSLFAGQGIKQDYLWNETSFIALSVIQKITALGYYMMILYTTLRLGETKWYQRGPWVAKYANLAVTARRNLSETTK